MDEQRSSDESQNPGKLPRGNKKRDRSSNEPTNDRARKLSKGVSDSELLDDINNLLFNLTIIKNDIELKHKEDPRHGILNDEDIKIYCEFFTELKNEFFTESKDEHDALNLFENTLKQRGSNISIVLHRLKILLSFFDVKKNKLSQNILYKILPRGIRTLAWANLLTRLIRV